MRGSSAWAMRRRGHASRRGSSPRKPATWVIAGLTAKAFRSAHPRRCGFSRALHAHRQCDLPASDRRRQVDAQARHPTRDRQDAGLGRESLYKALAPGASRVMTPSSSSRVRWECVCMRNRDNCTRRRALRCHGRHWTPLVIPANAGIQWLVTPIRRSSHTNATDVPSLEQRRHSLRRRLRGLQKGRMRLPEFRWRGRPCGIRASAA